MNFSISNSDSTVKTTLETALVPPRLKDMVHLWGPATKTMIQIGTIHEPKSRLSTDANQFRSAHHESDTRCVESPSSGDSLQHLAGPNFRGRV